MDKNRFDAISRALGGTTTRRRGLRAGVGALAAAFVAGRSASAARGDFYCCSFECPQSDNSRRPTMTICRQKRTAERPCPTSQGQCQLITSSITPVSSCSECRPPSSGR